MVARGIPALMINLKSRAKKSEGGELKPEYRLLIMVYGVILTPIWFFIYGRTAENHVIWIVLINGTFFVGTGLIITFVSSNETGNIVS